MFFDREKELEELTDLVSSKPSMITFTYGPINSGKTTLLIEFSKRLPREYIVFNINLRGRFIREEKDFIKVLFMKKEESESIKNSYKGIPIPEGILNEILENPFLFLEEYFEEINNSGRIPVLILDELQVIGDLRIDDLLIYKLFNFFVRLTKELHLAHVFVATSDSLFLERVHGEAMLHGRSRFMLVDDFDERTTLEFLTSNGLSEEEAKIAWHYLGGKPSYLVDLLQRSRIRVEDYCKEALKWRTSQILDSLYTLKGRKLRKVIELLSKFRENDEITYGPLSEEIVWSVRNNILFADPRERKLRPQGRLEKHAIELALEKLRNNF
ncbi:ATP-binding protein, putative [Pyrococcus abyssi GE5]|uniref:Uncharacterized ATP-binding protein PYRAB12000 n=2 Tax=Pyrococcus abyssi TaxID=29292 RepID=Y1200_PYRAB|nr:RecName: Full=Uncharacterized ATP-binding protein PYRAB12000 [Pyrococcus abyssi GE5]CAB50111.1 ATP-binding protein, putative [Pyrococcus abyssi GE5]